MNLTMMYRKSDAIEYLTPVYSIPETHGYIPNTLSGGWRSSRMLY